MSDDYKGKLGGGTGGAEDAKIEEECIATFSSEEDDDSSAKNKSKISNLTLAQQI